MTRKRRVHWEPGAQFAVPLPDGSYGIGQAIALMMPNVVYCALTSHRALALPAAPAAVSPADVVSRVAVSREQLDYGAWPILAATQLLAEKADFTNEKFASVGYVGAKVYDAALAEEFLAAFHGLAPWDDYHDPHYLDAWLTSPARKPIALRFRSDAPAS